MSLKDLYIVLSNEDVTFTAPTFSHTIVCPLKKRLQVKKANKKKEKKKEREKEKEKERKPLYRHFTNTLTKESLTCYLLLEFREPICIDMFYLWENQYHSELGGWFGNLSLNFGCLGEEPRKVSL